MRMPKNTTAPLSVAIRANRTILMAPGRPKTGLGLPANGWVSKCGNWATWPGNGFLWPRGGNTERRRVILSIAG